ncbi:uncharacterized protein DS421_12g357760 [Arachis hypogaea]|nr:uncharacterized protein DS421_12g357760 [Arachis hypogaea]
MSCPDSKCKVKYGPEYFCSLLPFEVFKRWQKVIKDCNTLILDKQLDKNPIHVADDEENSDVKEDAIVVIESDDDDVDYENIVDKKKKKNKKRALELSHLSRCRSLLSHSSSLLLSSPVSLTVSGLALKLVVALSDPVYLTVSGLPLSLGRSLAFPAIVVTDGRSSRSRDWSSSSLPVSSPSRSQSRAFVALVVAGGRSSRSRGFLLAVSNSRRQLPSRNQKLVPIW